jgi:hypothetical protein
MHEYAQLKFMEAVPGGEKGTARVGDDADGGATIKRKTIEDITAFRSDSVGGMKVHRGVRKSGHGGK